MPFWPVAAFIFVGGLLWLRRRVNTSVATTAPAPAPTNYGSAKAEIYNRMRSTGVNEFESWLGNTHVIFPASSWQNAREAGFSFEETLDHVSANVWTTLAKTARDLRLAQLYLTSLYRAGGTGPHTSGHAIDFGYIQRGGDPTLTLLRRTNGQPEDEPALARDLRVQLQQSPHVTQVLGPWHMWSKGEYDRENNEQSALDVEHLTHVHATVKG